MGRPKALKDSIPSRELRGTSNKKIKFSEDDFDNEESDSESIDAVPMNADDDDESDDDAPEVVSKAESEALYKLKEMHAQSMLLNMKESKLKKKQEAKALAASKRKSEGRVETDADAELDMGLLEEISSKKVKLDQEAEHEARLREEEEEAEEEDGFNYGSFNARKIGKITIKVLASSGGNKFEDEPDEALSIMDNYKVSSSAMDFANQLRAGQDRIKLSTKKAQKPRGQKKRR